MLNTWHEQRLEMDGDGDDDAVKAVEKVLSGAVKKVLSKFKAAGSSSRTSKLRSRGRDTEPSTSAAKSRSRDSDSSDSDDFQVSSRKSKKR